MHFISMLPLNLVIHYPPPVQIAYFLLSILIAIARKDLRLLLRDKAALFWLFGLPLLFEEPLRDAQEPESCPGVLEQLRSAYQNLLAAAPITVGASSCTRSLSACTMRLFLRPSSTRSTRARRRSKSAGFWRKSDAPRCNASTAVSMDPCAVRTITSAVSRVSSSVSSASPGSPAATHIKRTSVRNDSTGALPRT